MSPPPLPFEALAAWLASAPRPLAAGAIAAWLASAPLRRLDLHWSWPALVLAIAIAIGMPLRGTGLALAAMLVGAALALARTDRPDAARSPSWRSPLSALVTLTASLAHRPARGGVAAHELVLGRDERGDPVRVRREPPGHTLLLGATGAGKTVTQTLLATDAIARAAAVVVVDPKGDRDMLDALRRAAAGAGRAMLEWSPRGPSVYNPFARGGDGEIVDRLLAGERHTEPYYLRRAQRHLGHVVRALRAGGLETSLASVSAHADPEALGRLADRLDERHGEPVRAYLAAQGARSRAELVGVCDRLAILAESDVGPWLDPRTPGPRVPMLELLRERGVLYMALEADTRPLLAGMLGAAIVQDLVSAIGELQRNPTVATVVLDEFSALGAPQVARLFGRARSAGVSLVLATQELADLRPPGGEALLERVLGNVSLLVAHRQVVPASADLLASLGGRAPSWRVTVRDDGRRSRTLLREPALDPGRLLSLAPGWAAVLDLAAGAAPRITRVRAPGAGP